MMQQPDMDPDTRQPLHSDKQSSNIPRLSAGANCEFANLLNIPLEIRFDISSYLSLSDVANLRAACRQLEQELYDLFIRLFVQTPSLRRWRARTDAGLQIPWTEHALKWATFILGLDGNAEHVKKLHFLLYDDKGSRENRSLRYRNSDRCVQKSKDFAELRRQLVETESRCAGLLESIWRRTTNATTVVLETIYEAPIRFRQMDSYSMIELYQPLDIGLPLSVAKIRESGDEDSVQDYLESERLIYVSESFSQAFATLVDQVNKGVKDIENLLILAPVERTDLPMDLKNQGPAREFSNLGPSLTKLRSFEYGVDCVDLEYSIRNVTDRPKLHLSSLLSEMLQVQDFRLRSCSEHNVITPNAAESALSAFSSTCLTKFTLSDAVIRREVLQRFLHRYPKSLQELYLYDVSLIHGGWKPLLGLIKTMALKNGVVHDVFELCKSGNFTIMFTKNRGHSFRRRLSQGFFFNQSETVATRRCELDLWGTAITESAYKAPRLCMSTIQWAGAYFANELDETLENTKEIRIWE